jgi:hypothetical protein
MISSTKTTPRGFNVSLCDELLNPSRLWTRAEILSRPSPLPKLAGVYAWYFRSLDRIQRGSGHAFLENIRAFLEFIYLVTNNTLSRSRDTIRGDMSHYLSKLCQ